MCPANAAHTSKEIVGMPIDMSKEGMAFVARMAIRHPNVEFLTPIWQSYYDELGNGVCRGIVIGFIAAYLDSLGMSDAAMIKTYREKLRKLHQHLGEFNARQGDWKFNGKAGSFGELALRLSQHRATGSFSHIDSPVNCVFETSSSTFSGKGVYSIALNKHNVAYINNLNRHTFVDPNCGEFVTQHGNEMESFLSDYFFEVYAGTAQADPIGYIVHYPL
jgi:hypothetical protein